MDQENLNTQLIDNNNHQNQEKQIRWYNKFDLFAFLPVPKTYPVSTKLSVVGSLLFFFMIFVYIIVNFVDFLSHNVPKIVQLNGPINYNEHFYFQGDVQGQKIPYLAFAFQLGNDLNENMFDESYFNVTLEQIQQPKQGKKTYANVKAVNCTPQQQSWTKVQNLILQCPSGDLQMSGVLGQSDIYNYFRIVINKCIQDDDKTQKNITCKDENTITDMLGKGRFFVYLFKPETKDFITQKKIEQTIIVKQYFLVNKFYNRYELVLQQQNITEFPNYFTTWSQQNYNQLQIKQENFYSSQVNPYPQLLTVWFRMDELVNNVNVNYPTSLDKISQWGAFCSVIFSAFIFIMLRYNSQQFYKNNPEWSNFEDNMSTLKQLNKEKDIQLIQQKKEIEELNDVVRQSMSNDSKNRYYDQNQSINRSNF